MVIDKFACIGNIANIPDYSTWSQSQAAPSNVNTALMSPASREVRIRVRTKCAQDLASKYGYRDTNVIGDDPLDFVKWRITDRSVVEKISDMLGLAKGIGRVQIQQPGQMVMPHRDDLTKSYMGEVSEIEHYYNVTLTDQDHARFAQDPRSATRVLIMLEHWRIGQGFTTEHGAITHWRRGDVFAWDWPTTIHATFNNGYWPRPLLRVSGMVTHKWNQWFDAGNKFQLEYV